jgi:hypothetical protein
MASCEESLVECIKQELSCDAHDFCHADVEVEVTLNLPTSIRITGKIDSPHFVNVKDCVRAALRNNRIPDSDVEVIDEVFQTATVPVYTEEDAAVDAAIEEKMEARLVGGPVLGSES